MIDLDAALVAHLRVALASHIRALRRDGVEPSPRLVSLVDELATVTQAERDAAVRRRKLAQARSRRYRARRRGESFGPKESAACRESA
jgi:hypothetical protein